MNIGVVVGRFQTAFLTDGHKAVIKAAYEENDNLIIFLSAETVPFSIESPLPYEVREEMLKSELKQYGAKKLVQFYKLTDFKYSSTVCHVINQVLINQHGGTVNDFTLYFGANAFLATRYQGIGKVKVIDQVLTRLESAQIRREAYDMSRFMVSHNMGMIHAVGHRQPTTHVYICHLIYHGMSETTCGLLAIKPPDMKKLCLPLYEVTNVHSSPKDQANTWIKSKFPNGISGESRLVDAIKADDWRYRNSEDHAMYLIYMNRLFGGTEIPNEWIKKSTFDAEEWESEFSPIIPLATRLSIS